MYVKGCQYLSESNDLLDVFDDNIIFECFQN